MLRSPRRSANRGSPPPPAGSPLPQPPLPYGGSPLPAGSRVTAVANNQPRANSRQPTLLGASTMPASPVPTTLPPPSMQSSRVYYSNPPAAVGSRAMGDHVPSLETRRHSPPRPSAGPTQPAAASAAVEYLPVPEYTVLAQTRRPGGVPTQATSEVMARMPPGGHQYRASHPTGGPVTPPPTPPPEQGGDVSRPLIHDLDHSRRHDTRGAPASVAASHRSDRQQGARGAASPVTVTTDRRAGPLVTSSQRTNDITPLGTFVVSDVILHVASVPQFRQVWTAEEGSWIRVRDPVSGDVQSQHLLKASKEVTSMCASADGASVWCGLAEGAISVFSTTTKAAVAELVLHNGRVTSIVSSGSSDLIFSASADGRCAAWSRRSFHCVWATQVCDGPVTAIGVDDANSMLYAGSEDGIIRTLGLHGGQLVSHLSMAGHDGAVNKLMVVRAGGHGASHLWSGGADCTIRVWSVSLPSTTYADAVTPGTCLATLTDHKTAVKHLVSCPGEGKVWTASSDGFAVIYDDVTFGALQHLPVSSSNFRAHRQSYDVTTCVAPIANANVWRLWTCSSDGTVRGWMSQTMSTASAVDNADEVSRSQITAGNGQASDAAAIRESNILREEVAQLKVVNDQLLNDTTAKARLVAELEDALAAARRAANDAMVATRPPAPPVDDGGPQLAIHCDSLQRRLLHSEDQREQLLKRVDDLDIQLRRYQNDTSLRGDAAEAAERRVQSLQNELDVKVVETSRLESLVERLQRDVNAAKRVVDDERALSMAASPRAVQAASHAAMSGAMSFWTRALNDLEAESRHIMQALESSTWYALITLHSYTEVNAVVLAKANSRLTTELEDCKSRLRRSEDECISSRGRHAEADAASYKLRMMTQEHDSAMQSLRSELIKEAAGRQDAQAQLLSMQQQLSGAQEALAKIQQARANEADGQLREALFELQKLTSECNEKGGEINALKGRLRAAADDANRHVARMEDDFRLKLQLLRDESAKDAAVLKSELEWLRQRQDEEVDLRVRKFAGDQDLHIRALQAERDAVVHSLQQRVDDFEGIFANQKTEIDRLHAQLRQMSDDHAVKLRDVRETSMRDLERLRLNAVSTQDKTEADAAALIRNLKAHHEAEVAQLRQELQQCHSEIDGRAEVNERLDRQLQADRASHQKQAAILEADCLRRLESTEMEAREQVDRLKKELAMAEKLNQDMQTDCAARIEQRREQEDRRHQQELASQRKKYEDSLRDLTESRERLQMELAQTESRYEQRLAGMEERFQEKKVTEARRLALDTEAQSRERSLLDADRQTVEQGLRREVASLDERIRQLQSDRQKQADDHRLAIDKLQGQLDVASKEWQAALARAQAAEASSTLMRNDQEREKTQLVATRDSRIAQLMTTVEKLEAHVALGTTQLERERNEHGQALAAVEASCKSALAARDSLSADLRRANVELEAQRAEYDRQTREIVAARDAVAAATSKVKDVEATVADLRLQVGRLETSLGIAESARKQAEAAVALNNDTRLAAEQDAAMARRDVQALRRDVETQHVALKQRGVEAEEQLRRIHELNAALSDAQQAVNRLQGEKQSLTEQVKAAEELAQRRIVQATEATAREHEVAHNLSKATRELDHAKAEIVRLNARVGALASEADAAREDAK